MAEELPHRQLVNGVVAEAPPDEDQPGALSERADGPERQVVPTEQVVARKVVVVEDLGEHERVCVAAVRRQEHERVTAVELAQPLEPLEVGLDVVGPRVHRAQQEPERVDRDRALDGRELLEVGHRLGHDGVDGAPLALREGVDLGAERRARGDLLGDEPRHLVAVSDDRSVGAVAGDHGLAGHEGAERARGTARAGVLTEATPQHRHPRPLAGDDVYAIGLAPGDPWLESRRGPARIGQREEVSKAHAPVTAALARDPCDAYRDDLRVRALG